MASRIQYEDTCKVTCEDNGKVVDADILDFREGKTLSVSLNKSIKLIMPWNGRIYEGKMMGMSFVSNGPKGQKFTEGR
jgi:hypothetical protein